jgi:hypothetical protein
MATPNIVNVATINAKNATGAVTTSRASDKVAHLQNQELFKSETAQQQYQK